MGSSMLWRPNTGTVPSDRNMRLRAILVEMLRLTLLKPALLKLAPWKPVPLRPALLRNVEGRDTEERTRRSVARGTKLCFPVVLTNGDSSGTFRKSVSQHRATAVEE